MYSQFSFIDPSDIINDKINPSVSICQLQVMKKCSQAVKIHFLIRFKKILILNYNLIQISLN